MFCYMSYLSPSLFALTFIDPFKHIDKTLVPTEYCEFSEQCRRHGLICALVLLLICEFYIFFSGISGGERRRVTLGEMLLSHQKVLCLDNITTGLDSAVATDVIRMLRIWTDVTEGVVVASLLQPEPVSSKS
eukprot:TRINITY_DN2107_c0_g1_i1.p1 TRINITY_DN2107_c0_g1~~TRINITY_DN2107_c0_g1_i1.p1  ORF type:complete len:146 (-),score=20.29 TRINITY_DN2107_c0_g1_i1:34-429(-)